MLHVRLKFYSVNSNYMPAEIGCCKVYEAAAQIDSLKAQRSFQRNEKDNVKGDSLFVFDPNTIDYHSLLALGFSRNEALGIVKFRARGKRFEIKPQ